MLLVWEISAGKIGSRDFISAGSTSWSTPDNKSANCPRIFKSSSYITFSLSKYSMNEFVSFFEVIISSVFEVAISSVSNWRGDLGDEDDSVVGGSVILF